MPQRCSRLPTPSVTGLLGVEATAPHPTAPRSGRRVIAGLLLVLGMALPARTAAAGPPSGDPAECLTQDRPQRAAELFVAAGNGPPEDQSSLLKWVVEVDILLAGGRPNGSAVVDGLFWSEAQQRLTYQRSVDFGLCVGDEGQLHDAADNVRRQFAQESVLTFEQLPRDAPNADAVELRASDVQIAQFRDVLAADPVARQRLKGGSVTEDHTLILVAAKDDEGLARRIVGRASRLSSAVAACYGKREFVD
jgi:hypothetical protein